MASEFSHKLTSRDLDVIEKAMRDYSFCSTNLTQEQYQELLNTIKRATGGRLYFAEG